MTTGPEEEEATFCRFFSNTSLERFCAAWVMFDCPEVPFAGAPDPDGRGVDIPLLFCVGATNEASLRDASAKICLTFLLRLVGGFQFGLRKGR